MHNEEERPTRYGIFWFIQQLRTRMFPEQCKRNRTHYCTVCSKETSNGKPWCSEHVHTYSPYVIKLQRKLDADAA